MSINYTTYVAQISNLIVTSTADANFNTMLPGMIDAAEQRIYRELDLIATRVSDTTAAVSSGVRTFTMPTDQFFIVPEQFNIFTPVGATSTNATKNPLTPTTQEYIDFSWPTSTNTGVPLYIGQISNTSYVMGPTPDQAYTMEVVGTIRPAPLSAANSSTFLTQNLPDLFIYASMVFAAGYMRNFGAQADDPQMPGSWEALYQKAFNSANAEEFRKKWASQAWTAMQPNPHATPPRT